LRFLTDPKESLTGSSIGGASQHSAVISETERGLCDEFSDLCDGRRLFTMRFGKLGVGPEILDLADLLVFGRGTEFPFALRRHGDPYLFLGDCRVPSRDRHMLFSRETRQVSEDQVRPSRFIEKALCFVNRKAFQELN
jgi:hypothetical protein